MQELSRGAGWCWFGDPRAVYHNGRIYYGWVATNGHIWVTQVDTTTWTRRFALIAADTHVDDHNNPSILVRGGRVCVFWCGHRTGSTMRYRVAVDPDSVAAFGATQVCSAGNTPGNMAFAYPNLLHMGHDRAAYLFWRGGNFQPAYSRSTNMTGNVWSRAKHLFTFTGNHRPYVKVISDGDEWIHFLTTEAHPGNHPTSIWYVKWHLTDGTFRKANGQVVGNANKLPIPVTSFDRVYDGSGPGPRAWTWDLQLDPTDGRPRAAFSVLPSREKHELWAARHNGTAWTTAKVCDGGGTIAQNAESFYSGGIVLDPTNPDVVAVSRPADPARLHQVALWATGDGGVSWEQAAVVSDDAVQNVRPFYVRNAPAGLPWRLLWLRGTYAHFTGWQTDLVAATPPAV
jgi:BNR repeat-containing family member